MITITHKTITTPLSHNHIHRKGIMTIEASNSKKKLVTNSVNQQRTSMSPL